MKLLKYKIGMMLFATLFLFSCEDQLELVNPNQVSSEDFWVNETSAVNGTNAIYAALKRMGTYRRWLHFAYDVRSDEMMSQSPWGDLSNFSKFTINDYNFEVNYTIFQDHYRGIFRANQVLLNVPEIEMNAELKARLLGEAKFLRALYYFNLVNLYGAVPLANSVTTNPGEGFAQASEEELFAFIIADLKDAQASLPESYDSDEVGRATWGAATALLAKTYMQMNDYTSAKAEMKKIIVDKSNLYALESSFEKNFRHASENGVESVFEVQFSDMFENGGDQDGSATSSLGCNRSIFFAPTGMGWSDGEATQWLVDQFLIEKDKDGNIDPRMDVTLIWNKPADVDPVNNVYGTPFNTRFPVGHSKHNSEWIRKYLNDYWKTTENWDSPINFKVIRYADLLLLYAEALNETGETAKAYEYIDRVRERSNMELLSSVKPNLSKADMQAQIEHERIVELAGESVRLLDLQRWGKVNIDLQLHDDEFKFLQTGREKLPIPTKEVDLNDGVKQNGNW